MSGQMSKEEMIVARQEFAELVRRAPPGKPMLVPRKLADAVDTILQTLVHGKEGKPSKFDWDSRWHKMVRDKARGELRALRAVAKQRRRGDRHLTPKEKNAVVARLMERFDWSYEMAWGVLTGSHRDRRKKKSPGA